MANGHGGARPGSGPKTRADGRAVKPYTRRESKKTRDRSPELVASVVQTHPEARRRPLMSDQAIQTIVEAFREQQTRARNRPRTPEWNPYIIRPDRFGPSHKALKKAKLAMDDNTQLVAQNQFAVQAWQAGGMMPNAASEGLLFLGYPYLSELAQRPEFRLFGEIRSEEMTRKWIEIRGTEDESIKRTEKRSDKLATERNRNDDDRARAKERAARGEKPRTDERNKEIERKILELKDLMEEMKVRAVFKNIAAQDDYFGISHLHIDLHGTDLDNPRDAENRSSIGNGRDAISKEKLKRGCLRGLRVIEPIWCYPTNYNAFNPLAPDWYDPAVWYVMGAEIHKTRLLPFIGRPVPDILKPAYAFGGLSMTQMAQPYVDIWLRTRESVGEIIHAFSVMILATELGTTTMPGGSGGGNGDVVARMMLANMLRDNQGMMVIDKNTEDFKNVSAPLNGLDDLQAQSQEHLCSVARIPLVKYTGLQPKGLNASSDGEMRAFNDTVHGQQEHLYRPGLTTVIDVMQYHLWGERDPDITHDFLELHELNPKEKVEVKKLEAETDQIRIDSGVVSQEEVRAKLVADADSGFHGLDPDDVPDLLSEEEGGMIPAGAGRALEAEIGQPGAAGAGGGAKPSQKPQKKQQPAGEDSAGDPSTMFKMDLAQAKEVDRLGYLTDLRNVRIVRDRDQWNAGFDPDEDRAVFQRKFLDMPDEERLRVILHEGAHRAQFISDVDTFGRFVRLGLGTEENFRAMANEVHLEDFEATGEVDDLDGEVFAESYARFCLNMDMPDDLLEFWTDRRGEGGSEAKSPFGAEDEWNEGDHPRAPDGKFGSGSGSSSNSGTSVQPSKTKPSADLQTAASKAKVPQALHTAKHSASEFAKADRQVSAVVKHIAALHDRRDKIIEVDKPDDYSALQDLVTEPGERGADIDAILDSAREAARGNVDDKQLDAKLDPEEERELSTAEKQEWDMITARLKSLYPLAKMRARELAKVTSSYRKTLAAASRRVDALSQDMSDIPMSDWEPWMMVANALSNTDVMTDPVELGECLDYLTGGELSPEAADAIDELVDQFREEARFEALSPEEQEAEGHAEREALKEEGQRYVAETNAKVDAAIKDGWWPEIDNGKINRNNMPEDLKTAMYSPRGQQAISNRIAEYLMGNIDRDRL